MRVLLMLGMIVGLLVSACGGGVPGADDTPSPDPPAATRGEPTDTPQEAGTPTFEPTDPAGDPATPDEEGTGLANALPPVPDAPPARAVAITEDHRLVVMDTANGQELRTLAVFDDPETYEQESGEPIAAGRFLDSIALAPDGGSVLVSVCCEPAPGILTRLALEGDGVGDDQGGEVTDLEELERIAHGYEPAVRGDGERILVVELQWLTVLDADGEHVHRIEPEDGEPVAVSRPAWSPDFGTIAFERHEQPLSAPELMTIDADAGSMREARSLHRDSPYWSRPTFDRDGRLVVAQQSLDDDGEPDGPAEQLVVDPVSGEALERRPLPAGVRHQVHDASAGWLLAVLADGTARWWGPDGQEGTFGEGLRAAVW